MSDIRHINVLLCLYSIDINALWATVNMTGNVQPEAAGGSSDQMHGASSFDQASQTAPAAADMFVEMCAKMVKLSAALDAEE